MSDEDLILNREAVALLQVTNTGLQGIVRRGELKVARKMPPPTGGKPQNHYRRGDILALKRMRDGATPEA